MGLRFSHSPTLLGLDQRNQLAWLYDCQHRRPEITTGLRLKRSPVVIYVSALQEGF